VPTSKSLGIKTLAFTERIMRLGYSEEGVERLRASLLRTFVDLLGAQAAWFYGLSGPNLVCLGSFGADETAIKRRLPNGDPGFDRLVQILDRGALQALRKCELCFSQDWIAEHDITRILVFPLRSGESDGSLICAALPKSSSAPPSNVLSAIQTAASSVLARAMKVEMIREDAEANKRSAIRAIDLVRFARAIDVNDAEKIWDRAIEFLPKLFSAGIVSIFLHDEQRNKLILKRVHNQELDEDIEVDLSDTGEKGLMATAIKSRNPWLIEDVESVDATVRDGKKYKSNSCLIIPLHESSENKRLMGVVNLADPEGILVFGEECLDTAAIVGELLGTKVSNALLWAELQKLAVTDSLTGLYVHGHFVDTLGRELKRAKRLAKSLSLLMIDVDLFKRINDIYGHPAGDTALIAIAKCLIANVRESVDLVARYGGEEFAIILPETTKERAVEVANRIRKQIEQMAILNYVERDGKHKITSADVPGAKEFHASISIGVGAYPDDATTYGQLINIADAALYEGKAMGGNKVVSAKGPPQP